MLCVPTLSVPIESVAIWLPFIAEDPSCVVPSINFTVPVGKTPSPELTAAVNVADWLSVDGFAEEVNVVLVLPCTVWLNTDDVLALKLLSPP
jgi:hypothetical protein